MSETWTVLANDLAAAVANATLVVEKKASIPILQCVRIGAADDGRALVDGTNLDDNVQSTLTAPAPDAPILTPAHTLLATLKAATPGSLVTFAFEPIAAPGKDQYPWRLRLSGGVTAALPLRDPSDWPSLRVGDELAGFDIAGPAWRDLVDPIAMAISTEETRYYLNGIYLHAEERSGDTLLSAVATDGHRLSHRHAATLPDGALQWPGAIVPRLTVGILAKLLKKVPALHVGWAKCGNTPRLVFEAGNIRVISKAIDGSFPDYHCAIPAGNAKRLTFNAVDMLTAATQCARMGGDRNRGVKLSIETGKVTLTVVNPETGSFQTDIGADWSEWQVGGAMDLGLNARYLADMCALGGKGSMTFRIADAESPVLVETETLPRWLGVQMPMRHVDA